MGELSSRFDFISNVRGSGTLAAFTLPSTELRDEMRGHILEGGAHVLNSGFNSIRLRPSLTLSSDEVDEALSIFENAAKKLQGKEQVRM